MDNVDNLPGVFVKLNNKSTFQFCLGNSLKKESIKKLLLKSFKKWKYAIYLVFYLNAQSGYKCNT